MLRHTVKEESTATTEMQNTEQRRWQFSDPQSSPYIFSQIEASSRIRIQIYIVIYSITLRLVGCCTLSSLWLRVGKSSKIQIYIKQINEEPDLSNVPLPLNRRYTVCGC